MAKAASPNTKLASFYYDQLLLLAFLCQILCFSGECTFLSFCFNSFNKMTKKFKLTESLKSLLILDFLNRFQMLNGLFWRMNSGMEVNRILRMRQRRVAVSFNTPGRRELRRGAGSRDRCLEEEESSV